MVSTQRICVRAKQLKENGYTDLEDWLSKNENSVYVGRDMSYYVKGATENKWEKPFSKPQITNTEESLYIYERHIKETNLINEIDELKGKVLGCWCLPCNKCHIDVLIKILNRIYELEHLVID